MFYKCDSPASFGCVITLRSAGIKNKLWTVRTKCLHVIQDVLGHKYAEPELLGGKKSQVLSYKDIFLDMSSYI